MDTLVIIAVIALILFILWLIAIGDLMSRPDEDFPGKSDKLCWAIILTFTGFFGLIAYMIYGPSTSSVTRTSENSNSDDHIHRAELGCLQCGAQIPAGSDKCPECGWSYAGS